MNLSKYLGDKAFWKITLALGLPIAFQNMLTSSFSLVDTLMVSMLGDISLAAAGMAGQWSWLLNIFLFGVCSGAAIFISQYFGVDDRKGIHRTAGIAMTSGFILGGAFMIAACCFPHAVMRIFGDEEAVIEEGVAYLRIAGFSYFAVVINAVWSSVLRSTAQVKLPMYVAIITTVENAALNYFFIFGGFGWSGLGIRGAALATVVSSWTGAILLIAVSMRKGNILYAPLKELFCFTKEGIVRFYKKALPVMANESMWGLGTFCYNAIFGALGYENYEAVTIIRTFESIAFAFFVGLCNACCIMVGRSVGLGKIDRAWKDAIRFTVLVPLLGAVVGWIIVLFRAPLVSVFNLSGNISSHVLETAQILLAIYALELPLRNIPYTTIVGVFRSGGDASTGVIFDLVGLWCVGLPTTLIAAFALKVPFPVVFACMYLFDDGIKSILCIRHFRKTKWLKPVTPEGQAGLVLWQKEHKK